MSVRVLAGKNGEDMTNAKRQSRGLLVSGLAAAALVSMLVVRTSQAVFTASITNAGNSVAAGDVNLTDGSASTMFSVTAMEPGQTEIRCVTVTYDGSIPDPSTVKLYSGGYTNAPLPTGATGIDQYLNLTVEEGSLATAGDCGTFAASNTVVGGDTLQAFDGAHTDYATGVGTWDPAATPETTTYRFSLELDAATPNTEQDAGVSDVVFAWEVQN